MNLGNSTSVAWNYDLLNQVISRASARLNEQLSQWPWLVRLAMDCWAVHGVWTP